MGFYLCSVRTDSHAFFAAETDACAKPEIFKKMTGKGNRYDIRSNETIRRGFRNLYQTGSYLCHEFDYKPGLSGSGAAYFYERAGSASLCRDRYAKCEPEAESEKSMDRNGKKNVSDAASSEKDQQSDAGRVAALSVERIRFVCVGLFEPMCEGCGQRQSDHGYSGVV